MINDVVVGSVRDISIKDRHAQVDVVVEPDALLPANAVATVGQTSLLGSMHLQLGPPLGEPATGRLPDDATIPLDRSSSYPSTERTLASLAAVVNGGGLGQIGEVIHSLNDAFTGRQDIRQLLGRLDEFVGVLNDQRDGVIATLTELNRLADRLAGQRARHNRCVARDSTCTRRAGARAAEAVHGAGSPAGVQRHRDSGDQRHAGRPGTQPAEPRTDDPRAGRCGTRHRHRAGVRAAVPARTEPGRSWHPRGLHEPLRHHRPHQGPVEARPRGGDTLGRRERRVGARPGRSPISTTTTRGIPSAPVWHPPPNCPARLHRRRSWVADADQIRADPVGDLRSRVGCRRRGDGR